MKKIQAQNIVSNKCTNCGGLFSIVVFMLLFVALVSIFKVFFPLPGFRMGHDYALGLPGLLDGYFWFRNNGLSAPWFTPSFCAGQPFYADPQSGYYSLVHGLAFFVDPVTASYLLLLIAASLAYWGGFLLMRYVFATGYAAAVLAGGLLMFNAFMPSRIAIGHLGYHAFALLPWIALLLLVPVRRKIDGLSVSIAAGMLLAYWVHGGLGTLMIPAGMGVLIIALLHGLRGGGLAAFFGRSAIAVAVALCVSAAKLSAGMALMSNISRNYYSLPGMHSVLDALAVILSSLFLFAEHTYIIATPRVENLQWALQPHEWGFGFTPAVAILIFVLSIALLVHRKSFALEGAAPGVSLGLRGWVIICLLAVCLFWPVAFNTYEASWNAFLKSVPILGSASTPTRWIVLYIPFVAVIAALMLQKLRWKNTVQWAVVISALFLTVVLTAVEPRDFYLSQNYDIRPVVIADRAVREGKLEPKIRELGVEVNLRTRSFEKVLQSNDTFIAGISQVACYNPIFGYRLEKFSTEGLVEGDVLQEQGGYLNLKNPACYVFPRENNCQPGDRFRADQIEEARRFVSYRPYSFSISKRQEWMNAITQWSLSLVGLYFLVLGGGALWRGWGREVTKRESYWRNVKRLMTK